MRVETVPVTEMFAEGTLDGTDSANYLGPAGCSKRTATRGVHSSGVVDRNSQTGKIPVRSTPGKPGSRTGNRSTGSQHQQASPRGKRADHAENRNPCPC